MIDPFPRLSLAHLPTPLEPMPRLSAALDGPEIWIKRDDCTGLSTGGNKARKLEFLMAEAQAQGAEIVVPQGATQSNHARQTAAAAAKLGMECHLILEDRTGYNYENYRFNGNILIDVLHGATIEHRPPGLDMRQELDLIVEAMRDVGRNVYSIPGGGSNPTGALGYVTAAFEMLSQFEAQGIAVDCIVHATGSAGTQAGLLVGLRAAGSPIKVLGIGVNAPRNHQEEAVYRLACATAERIGKPGLIARADVAANCDYVGLGYGMATDESNEAIDLFAQTDAILLDPVYSAKAASGLIDLTRKGQFRNGERIVFLHTGGAASLSAYTHEFDTMAVA